MVARWLPATSDKHPISDGKVHFAQPANTKNSGIISDLMDLDFILIPDQISTVQVCDYVNCYTWSNVSSWVQK